jgi:hypothetical protein
MHRRNCKRAAFYFLDRGLLVGDRFNEKLTWLMFGLWRTLSSASIVSLNVMRLITGCG